MVSNELQHTDVYRHILEYRFTHFALYIVHITIFKKTYYLRIEGVQGDRLKLREEEKEMKQLAQSAKAAATQYSISFSSTSSRCHSCDGNRYTYINCTAQAFPERVEKRHEILLTMAATTSYE